MRNNISSFEVLRGCRIIEGFLQIVLINIPDTPQANAYTFPELVEITDYMALYHVNGLRTLSHLFPNLRVIRGVNLLTDYALALFENAHMIEVGLPQLTHILRGGVRIAKNPLMCFSDSVSWSTITGDFPSSIADNQKVNECPLCSQGRDPRADAESKSMLLGRTPAEQPSSSASAADSSPAAAAAPAKSPSSMAVNAIPLPETRPFNTAGSSSSSASSVAELTCPASPDDPKKRLCWNANTCQRVCDVTRCGVGTACSANGTCCSPECAGGCEDGQPDACFACRHFRLYDSSAAARPGEVPRMRCVKDCPAGMYAFNSVRCVTADECRRMWRPFTTSLDDTLRFPYTVLGLNCTDKCPMGYERNDTTGHRVCDKCDGPCKVSCPSATIDSIWTAQRFRGCNIVTGDLSINIRSPGACKCWAECFF